MNDEHDDLFYAAAPETAASAKNLVVPGSVNERRFVFHDGLEIGRHQAGRPLAPGLLLVADPTVSWRHCVLTQSPDGRCYVRDVSRNGTRIDGRRLVPNVEVELDPGQTLSVGRSLKLQLDGRRHSATAGAPVPAQSTVGMPGNTVATVLVGDIRDYTGLVRRGPSDVVQESVGRVFDLLTQVVVRHGGTVKEYQGDAIFAFWEGTVAGDQALQACKAALALHDYAREMARDPGVWAIDDFRLEMDWALTTGTVAIGSFGGDHPTGMSMIGEPVVLAFRLEKFADGEGGAILTCPHTRAAAEAGFIFDDLGERRAKGFDAPDQVFALKGLRGSD